MTSQPDQDDREYDEDDGTVMDCWLWEPDFAEDE